MPELEMGADNFPGGKCCLIVCKQKQRFYVGANGVDDYTLVCADHVEEVKREGDAVVPIGSA